MRRIKIKANSVLTIQEPNTLDPVKSILIDLLHFRHLGDKRIFNARNSFYEKGDENCLFFSEAYLYNLFEDKDAARSLLGSLNMLIVSLGYDWNELMKG